MAADVEQRAHQLARGYIRTVREDGASWHEIGAALGLAADDAHDSTAEAAFDYAAPADSYYARIYGPTFNWRCPACDGLIRDLGPYEGSPAKREEMHGPGCRAWPPISPLTTPRGVRSDRIVRPAGRADRHHAASRRRDGRPARRR